MKNDIENLGETAHAIIEQAERETTAASTVLRLCEEIQGLREQVQTFEGLLNARHEVEEGYQRDVGRLRDGCAALQVERDGLRREVGMLKEQLEAAQKSAQAFADERDYVKKECEMETSRRRCRWRDKGHSHDSGLALSSDGKGDREPHHQGT